MAAFSYNTAAELFPAAIRKKKRAGFAYRRFGTAAEAVRFAIEELPADSLNARSAGRCKTCRQMMFAG